MLDEVAAAVLLVEPQMLEDAEGVLTLEKVELTLEPVLEFVRLKLLTLLEYPPPNDTLLAEGLGEEYRLKMLFFKSGLPLILCCCCCCCCCCCSCCKWTLSLEVGPECCSRSNNVGFVRDLFTLVGRSGKDDDDRDWLTVLDARGGLISNKEERGSESVLVCCVAVFEAAVGALEVVTGPALTC